MSYRTLDGDGATLNDDAAAALNGSNIATTTADACTIVMAEGIECSVARHSEGAICGYEDAGVAGAEAFDIVLPTNDDGGVSLAGDAGIKKRKFL